LPPEYEPGETQSGVYASVVVQSVALPKGGAAESVDSLPAGSLVLVGGIDKYVARTCTLVSASLPLEEVRAVRGMNLKVSPVVAQSVRPTKNSDQAAFSKALIKLSKTGFCCCCSCGCCLFLL
jgi:translation elongation factor EF-G